MHIDRAFVALDLVCFTVEASEAEDHFGRTFSKTATPLNDLSVRPPAKIQYAFTEEVTSTSPADSLLTSFREQTFTRICRNLYPALPMRLAAFGSRGVGRSRLLFAHHECATGQCKDSLRSRQLCCSFPE